ncbi:uncharacterized protein METZ01_LOCUS14770, partial [marine metagenome]
VTAVAAARAEVEVADLGATQVQVEVVLPRVADPAEELEAVLHDAPLALSG